MPAGFGGEARGKGPRPITWERDLAAQPILLLEVLLQYHREVALSGDQELVEAFPADLRFAAGVTAFRVIQVG